jgi:hypothetical protein
MFELRVGPSGLAVVDARDRRWTLPWSSVAEQGAVDGCFALVVARPPTAWLVPLDAFEEGGAKQLERLLVANAPSDAPDGTGPTPSGPPSWGR